MKLLKFIKSYSYLTKERPFLIMIITSISNYSYGLWNSPEQRMANFRREIKIKEVKKEFAKHEHLLLTNISMSGIIIIDLIERGKVTWNKLLRFIGK